jgi:glycosyltransferase involved in cell wall biosynthesis
MIGREGICIESHYLAGNFAEFSPLRESQSQSSLPSKPLILCVGTFEPRKNQINVLRAAAMAKSKGAVFELAFVGNPGWKNDEFENERIKLDPSGEYTSVISSAKDGELAALYSKSIFSLFCSHEEGFGLPIIESLHFGKPVITSNRSSMRELAETLGGCVLIDPDHPNQIAEKIVELLNDPILVERLTRSIKPLPDLTWQQYASKIRAFCENS